MTTTLDQPIISPVLVGRDDHITALERAIEQVIAGRACTLLVSGEAGIGKSRLLREGSQRFATISSDTGLILRGHCFESDHMSPFAPLLDLWRAYLTDAPSADIEAVLCHGIPDLRWQASVLAALSGKVDLPATRAERDPEDEKRHIFQTLLSCFSSLAARQPTLVILEDLHWSDDTSLEFVLHLARRIAAWPLLLVLTYRSDEVHPALRHTLSMLDRERLASELVLDRLDLREVERMLQALFGQSQPIRPDFLRELYALTDGNPFFVEEVVRSLVAAGDIYQVAGRWQRKELRELHIPRSVEDAVQRRVGRLSEAAGEVLRLAAVVGQRFDFEVVRRLLGWPDSLLLAALKELIGAQLIVEESVEQFAFRHALTRQAVYGQLLARERQTLHRSIAWAIEEAAADGDDSIVAQLAYHYDAAGDAVLTLRHAERAGRRALAMHAPREAVEQYSRALAATERAGVPPHQELYRGRADALAILGEFDGAERDYQATLALARAASDLGTEWQALFDLGVLWHGRDYGRAGTYLRQACDLARSSGDQRIHARSLIQLGNWQVNTEQLDDARESLLAALALADALDDQPSIALANDILGIVADLAGDLPAMRASFERAIALYRALDDRTGLASALATITSVAGAPVFDAVVVPAGAAGMTLSEALALTEESLALTRDIGWRAGESYALLHRALHAYQRASFGSVLVDTEESLRITREIEHPEWMTVAHILFGLLHHELLDVELARRWLTDAHALARASGSGHFLHATAANLTTALIAGGELTQAAAVLDALQPGLPMRTGSQRLVWLARAELALAQNDPHAALDIVDRLLASALHLVEQGDIPHIARQRGEALRALGRLDDARIAFASSARGAEARGMRSIGWRIDLALGRLEELTGREDVAQLAFERAWHTVAAIAADTGSTELGAAFLGRAAASFPGFVTHAASSTAARDPARLTEREREVAALIAEGKSNREIAEQLYVGRRTIETHVGNILNRLSFSSRAQIAAWAVEQRLAGDAAERR